LNHKVIEKSLEASTWKNNFVREVYSPVRIQRRL